MKELKKIVSRAVLFFLGRGVKVGYTLDSRIKEELTALGDNYSVRLKASETGPALSFFVENGKVKTLRGKKSTGDKPALDIVFKNIDAGFLVLSGQQGIAQSYAQHRMLVYGDIYTAMSIVRIMALLENYLFPPFITNKILLKRPKKEVSSLRFYLRVLTAI